MEFFRRHARLSLILILVFANIFIWYAASAEGGRSNILTIAFLDIDQGDAIYIEAPNGNQLVVDGGPGTILLRRLAEVMPAYDRSLDMILVTNPDKDHMAGFVDALASYEISFVVEPGTLPTTLVYKEFEKSVEKEGAEHTLARRGEIIWLDKEDGVYLLILFPDKDVSRQSTNDGSIVAKLVYGKTSVMLTGDAPDDTERYLISLQGKGAGGLLDSDILKVGHHGSKTSTSPAFVEAVSPEYAVISDGKGNSYGHPHPITLQTLENASVPVFRTDLLGTIIFQSDGTRFWQKE
ncbi:MAG: hypothetical protein A2836_01285 [Candidatus Taylorbacteria bacterium RIFCSPHIGHO2_01_FULL_45_63]|uniref:Metallo-beta-lactamase domain-containing protein n=1 Tax=Candidatus Taylorbacteria bacterium RIFCSPHIGHO2_02_FULL_45_35 TaxID=1802311 RepID=A0A1G2MS03_9BACT|nr:MAG: hypothetical protein A2836_01285 [Candidatus Taylorbacteria bacterium RIFCSPHIGHO2_01_FULL_45_63]OHA25782.1 MAG: hypothetical protein A3D56_01615 [Candidatus Taylorbacteria bacterium RIFCSPHIGHO2_02_FULL_45_35]OHA32299.1 MAG: hypothetical protein A3A22_01830 [Candidatus Taylorbacteria bacterium RIFCSPLOWO2_01_FULL_45_34b]